MQPEPVGPAQGPFFGSDQARPGPEERAVPGPYQPCGPARHGLLQSRRPAGGPASRPAKSPTPTLTPQSNIYSYSHNPNSALQHGRGLLLLRRSPASPPYSRPPPPRAQAAERHGGHPRPASGSSPPVPPRGRALGASAACSSSAPPAVDASSSCFPAARRIPSIPFSSRGIQRRAPPSPPAVPPRPPRERARWPQAPPRRQIRPRAPPRRHLHSNPPPPTVATSSSPPRAAPPPHASSSWIRPRSPWIRPPHRSSSADGEVASSMAFRSNDGSLAPWPPPLSLSLGVVGLGPARHAGLAVLLGLARHEKRPSRPCLGRQPGTKPMAARPARHVVPCWPDPHRAVPGRPVGHLQCM